MHTFWLMISIQVALCSCHYMYGPDRSWNIRSKGELKSKDFWFHDAQRTVYEKTSTIPNQYLAKNIILFLGDGMSVPTVTAARIYDGQKKGIVGERNRLEFEKFNYVGLSKTYCADKQVSDSAATASAYLSGIKANYLTIGVSADVKVNDCEAAKSPSNRLSSIATWAMRGRKSAGLVTTTRVTHASPAGVYAHTSNRDFESDFDVKDQGHDPSKCPDIAQQLLSDEGQRLKVVMGGGTRKFLPNTEKDVYGNVGERLDGRNLINEWQRSKHGNAQVVFNRTNLLSINPYNTDYLLGLFNASHLAYKLDDSIDTPTLEEMTETAIKVLSANPGGFFLFVEGGRIDHAHHETKAKKAMEETVQFSNAVKKARELTNPWETLIVVTADHGHTMTINGYPDINNDITGLSSDLSDLDYLPYATLSYANGPEMNRFYELETSNNTVKRVDLRNLNIGDKDARYPHGVPYSEETHGGGDVAVYANGPWSHLFSGVYEQNTIPHLMGFASCIGPGITYCDLRPKAAYVP
ncbi:PREDICTED: membrane-bound alkaline phosphatase [Drosophila arizonae]|uniref:alkaline phosphatase n=1 Tax=Drosophila arizonae TaxID=7263 RepID=A0ABM1P7Z9_DROAR|nr:PREDICTED: membrane-bound alkaline phosphatase [Drosophila arizonae]